MTDKKLYIGVTQNQLHNPFLGLQTSRPSIEFNAVVKRNKSLKKIPNLASWKSSHSLFYENYVEPIYIFCQLIILTNI